MTAYGHFSEDGSEYVVTDPRTPRPWINIITNPRVGLAVSQTGSGFSWIDNSQLAVMVRWLAERGLRAEAFETSFAAEGELETGE